MKFLRFSALLLAAAAALGACTGQPEAAREAAPLAAAAVPAGAGAAPAPAVAPAVAPAGLAAPAPAADTARTVPAGPPAFDLAAVPVATPRLGAFPYFSLLDGYAKGDAKTNMISTEAKKFLQNVAFDRYEFFDGRAIIPVEGRLATVKALGEGASFFQVQKTYEKLVRDLGGVTVWEGDIARMKPLHLAFADGRHRGQYMPEYEKAGVYLLRTPDREIWVEAYQTWDDHANYWLTVVERKALPMQATVLPAAEMKKALDASGHVALYLNFDTDQATLKPDAQATLAQIISLLAQNPALALTVQGHTDNAGPPAHNQQLSEARARTVVATLAAQGIAPERLQAQGLGQTKPLADNATEAGRALNRRVELVKR